jgi:hypothetical protein
MDVYYAQMQDADGDVGVDEYKQYVVWGSYIHPGYSWQGPPVLAGLG